MSAKFDQNEYARRWRAANRDRVRALNREYRARHRDELNAKAAADRAANPELYRAKDRARHARDRDKRNAACRARASTPEGRARARAWQLKSRYGMSLADFQARVAAQGGECAIKGCGRPATCVDHDHATGAVRKILCHQCNAALGALGECSERARGLADYMAEHGCKRRETTRATERPRRARAEKPPPVEGVLFA